MIYLASPFFCRFDKLVKKYMKEAIAKESGKNKFHDPETAGNFTELKNQGCDAFTSAKKIYEDNIESLNSCSSIVFPKRTSDLGTLFEVGYSISYLKEIYSYDFLYNKLEKIDYESIFEKTINLENKFKNNDNILVKIEKGSDAVFFGALANSYLEDKLIYELSDVTKDNLMLAARFPIKIKNKIIKPEERTTWETTK